MKRSKPGDTIPIDTSYLDARHPSCPPLLIRVVEARASTKDNPGSRLALQFERPATASQKASPLRLEIQAVAAPELVRITLPLVIADRFPCDPNVARNKCAEPQTDDNSPPSRLTETQEYVCQSKQHNNQAPQQGCCLMSESRGIYGYPDLSLSPTITGSSDAPAIISANKNVKLAEGTYLILSGADAESLLLLHP